MPLFQRDRALPDAVSQYLWMRSGAAAKSSEEAGSAKGKGAASGSGSAKPVARLRSDCSRTYFPGQEVACRVEVDESVCAAGGSLDELRIECKGEVSSFVYIYAGQGGQGRQTHYETVTLFSASYVLFSRSADAPPPEQTRGISATPAPPSLDEPAAPTRAWDVRFTLPSYCSDRYRSGKLEPVPLPASFKDTTSGKLGGSSHVVYTWKAVGVRRSSLARDTRVWLPFHVSPIATAPAPPPEVLRLPPVPSQPTAMPELPPAWQRRHVTQTWRNALLIKRGELRAELCSPPLEASPTVPIPFLLLLTMTGKSQADVEPGSSKLPRLPLEATGGGPVFSARRATSNGMRHTMAALSEHDFLVDLPLRVDWSTTHLGARPAQGSSATGAGALELRGPGHGWSKAVAAPDGSWSSTALLSGMIHCDLSPAFYTPTLSVSYVLQLAVPLSGPVSLREELGELNITSGVRIEDLFELDAAEATRRAVGSRAALLVSLNSAQGQDDERTRIRDALPDYGADDGTWDGWDDKKTLTGAGGSELPEYDDKGGLAAKLWGKN